MMIITNNITFTCYISYIPIYSVCSVLHNHSLTVLMLNGGDDGFQCFSNYYFIAFPFYKRNFLFFKFNGLFMTVYLDVWFTYFPPVFSLFLYCYGYCCRLSCLAVSTGGPIITNVPLVVNCCLIISHWLLLQPLVSLLHIWANAYNCSAERQCIFWVLFTWERWGIFSMLFTGEMRCFFVCYSPWKWIFMHMSLGDIAVFYVHLGWVSQAQEQWMLSSITLELLGIV